MFALQDCSICFEEYDSERGPHNIIFGHVFCRPCLESLASSSPNCPNCRAPFALHMIRKVVCARQDPPAPGAGVVSEAETVMWQTIQTAVGSAGEHEHRRSLVQNNSAWAVQAAGLSGHVLIALDIIRLLVDVERTNHGLNHQIDTARAFEASLRDNILLLEAQLSTRTLDSSTSIDNFQSILSEMRDLKSSISTINETTTQIAQKLSSAEPAPTPAPVRPPPMPTVTQSQTHPTAEPLRSTSSSELPRAPEQLRSLPQPRPSVLRKQFPRGRLSIFTPSTASLVEPQEPQSSGPGHQRAISVSSLVQANSPSVSTMRIVSSSTPAPSMSRQVVPPTPTSLPLMSPPLTPGVRPSFEQGLPLFNRNNLSYAGAQLNMKMPVPTIPSQGGANSSACYGTQQPTPVSTPTTSQTRAVSPPPYQSQPEPLATPTSSVLQEPASIPSNRTITALHDYTADSATELSFSAGDELELMPDSDADLGAGNEWVWCELRGNAGYAPRSYLRE